MSDIQPKEPWRWKQGESFSGYITKLIGDLYIDEFHWTLDPGKEAYLLRMVIDRTQLPDFNHAVMVYRNELSMVKDSDLYLCRIVEHQLWLLLNKKMLYGKGEES